MQQLLYGELTPWYRLLDPVADHADEAAAYVATLERGGATPGGTLLELGAGAGGNASFIKSRFRCTLTDISPEMLALSRALNPSASTKPVTCARCGSGGCSTPSWCTTPSVT